MNALLVAITMLAATSFAGPPEPAHAPLPLTYPYLKHLQLPVTDSLQGKRAIEEIKRAIEAAPKNADHYYNLAIAYAVIVSPPDIPAARTAYKTALELGGQGDPAFEHLLKSK